MRIVDSSDLRQLLIPPTATDHKYSRGVAGIICGSDSYPGAAVMAVTAAIRSGVGLVRFLGDVDLVESLLAQRPEVVLMDGKVDAYLVGSGIDSIKRSALLTNKINDALDSKLPIVIDAGALDLARSNHALQVITPHSAELSKLFLQNQIDISTDTIKANPEKYARLAADEFKTTVLLKGNTTFIASHFTSELLVVPNSTPRLATAGTGDVLAGILVSLLAQQKPIDPVKFQLIIGASAYLHAKAAANLAKTGPFAALDLTYQVAEIIGEFT